MLPSTLEATRAIVKADPTISPGERTRILSAVRTGGKDEPAPAPTPTVDGLVRRESVAKQLSRSTRAVDYLAEQGILHRVRFPGRTRAAGFLQSEVSALLRGGTPPSIIC